MTKSLNTAAFLLYAACAIPAARCQDVYRQPWLAPTIFVAEIEQVNAGPGFDPSLPVIKAKAVRILRDDFHQGLHPGEFTASGIMNPDIEEELKTEKQYVILSRQKGGLAAALEDSHVMILDAEGNDYADDLYSILDLTSLPFSEQVHAAAVLIGNPAKPHTHFLARYAVALLATGTESDTA